MTERLAPFLPRAARHPALASGDGWFAQDAVTVFVDLAGFTSLSERLARHGTPGTEELGMIVRRVIGGSIDAVTLRGGDAVAFGGDAITAAFAAPGAADRAREAAEDVIRLVGEARGMPTRDGPLDVAVRVGISAGRVTSLVCPARDRHVLAHIGPGLDAAVRAQEQAAPGDIVVDPAVAGHDIDPLELEELPAWAARVLHPVTTSRLLEGGAIPEEHRRLTTAFLSLPPIDDRDPGALARLAEFAGAAADLVGETGGDLLQCTGGDKGVVLHTVFGAPVAHPDDAVRAVHFVERMRATGASFGAGVATGLVFAAAYGGATRFFLTGLGDATNLAARLMAAAGTGRTLVDGATSEALAESVHLGGVQEMAVKGKAVSIAVSEVRGLATADGRFDGAGDTAVVGRAEELAAADALLAAAVAGSGGSLWLAGPAGSGKSRLVREVIRRARVRGVEATYGAFEAFGLGQPLGPFAELLRRRLGGSVSGAEELADRVAAIRPDARPLAGLLAPFLGIPGSAGAGMDAERGELARGLAVDLLCSDPEPALVVIEDAHWADEASREVLAELLPRLAATSLAVIVTERRDADAEGERDADAVLAELGSDDLATVVRDTWGRLGGGPLPAAYVGMLVERSSGSPLFAETVTELVRRGYRPGEPLPDAPLPDQLLPFLTARLDALGDSPQRAALSLAVVGRPTTSDELAAIFGGDSAGAAADLDVLATAGIARPIPVAGMLRVWLRHATLAEALIARASHADRAPLHQRMALHLVGAGASAREIARHVEHCSLPDLEQRWYRRARDEAASIWSLREARHWAALTATGADRRHHAADVLALAEVEQQLGDHAQAVGHLDLLDDPDRTVTRGAERLQGRIAFETGRLAEAIEHLEAAEDMGEQGAAVSWPLTMALCDLGRFDEARTRATAQLAAAGDDATLRLDALANLGVVAFREGNLDEASAVLEEAQRIAAAQGDLIRLAHITGDLAGARFMTGRLPEAVSLLDEATALAHRLGARRLVTMTLGNASQVRLAGGDLEGAARVAVASTESALRIGDVAIALDCLQVPAVVAELREERERAAGWWERHARLEERLGRPHDAAISWLRFAALAAAGGDAVAGSVIEHADAVAGDLATDDLTLHRARAADASAGLYAPPPEAVTAALPLPPLDASLPEATPAEVDDLFDRVDAAIDVSG